MGESSSLVKCILGKWLLPFLLQHKHQLTSHGRNQTKTKKNLKAKDNYVSPKEKKTEILFPSDLNLPNWQRNQSRWSSQVSSFSVIRAVFLLSRRNLQWNREREKKTGVVLFRCKCLGSREERQKREKNFTVFVIFFLPKRRRNCVVQLPPEMEKVGKRRRRFEVVKLKEEGKE